MKLVDDFVLLDVADGGAGCGENLLRDPETERFTITSGHKFKMAAPVRWHTYLYSELTYHSHKFIHNAKLRRLH